LNRVVPIRSVGIPVIGYGFDCPGCKEFHLIYTNHPSPSKNWTFNGDLVKPTFSPSLLVRWGADPNRKICHSFIRDGKIEFLTDCTHQFAGKTLELPEIKD
jgi:hypothetical protein